MSFDAVGIFTPHAPNPLFMRAAWLCFRISVTEVDMGSKNVTSSSDDNHCGSLLNGRYGRLQHAVLMRSACTQ